MRRVLIAGIGGSGKTTLARRLAPVLGRTYHHLDGLYLGPDLRISPTFVS
jgi:uridine kinase